jgi:hypothetical protein
MKAADFNSAVRKELLKVSLEDRKSWDGTELLIWWQSIAKENTSLRCPQAGDQFRQVKVACKDMYGKTAI